MTDPLVDRYYELCFTNNFDAAQYAQDWLTLAEEFEKGGRVAMASMCRGRAKQYSQMQGEYVRLTEGSFAELVEVSA